MRKRNQGYRLTAYACAAVLTAAMLGGCTNGNTDPGTSQNQPAETTEESDKSGTNPESNSEKGSSEELGSTDNPSGEADPSEREKASEGITEEETEPVKASKDFYKGASWSNPISPNVFCADPTAIEYEGRLYVFGTNDQQQYDIGGEGSENTYEKIKSLVIYSSDDLINWTYHGVLDVNKVAPWIYNSWAPSIVSRVEEDGLTHFYMYFSNTGAGVGVITSTDPLGPWSDPLGKPLISGKTPGLKNCPIPFDPGVCFDDEGRGWMAFGGGQASTGSEYMPGVARIVRLGEDMISLDSEIAEVPAPYFNEASELNFMNGTWVYTYNTSWADRTVWENPDYPKPTTCSMVYMTSTDPLNPDSWTYRGEYFANPGTFGMGWGNNHTHLQKFQDRYFLTFHCQEDLVKTNRKGGYRNLAIMEMKVDEETQTIEKEKGSIFANYKQLKDVDAFEEHPAACFSTAAGIKYSFEGSPFRAVTGIKATESGAWTVVRSVSFGEKKPAKFTASLSGIGTLEIRTGSQNGDTVLKAESTSEEPKEYTFELPEDFPELTETTDLYFVLTEEGMELNHWTFEE